MSTKSDSTSISCALKRRIEELLHVTDGDCFQLLNVRCRKNGEVCGTRYNLVKLPSRPTISARKDFVSTANNNITCLRTGKTILFLLTSGPLVDAEWPVHCLPVCMDVIGDRL